MKHWCGGFRVEGRWGIRVLGGGLGLWWIMGRVGVEGWISGWR